MPGTGLDYSALFNRDLPPPSAQWEGHPKYNFIGGHSDPDLVPMVGFIESANRVFRGDPRNIWVRLPESVDSRDLVAPALREGIAFNPGPGWSADPDAAGYIRLCFALPTDSEIREGIEKLADVFRAAGALP